MHDIMVDSYLAPTDLAEARQQVEEAVDAVTTRGGDGVTYRLTKEPFDQQRHLIAGAVQCVVADVVLWSWDQDSLSELSAALRPDRTLVFLEPTAELGWRHVVHRTGSALWRLFLRHDFQADIPAALRASGMTVTTTNRFGFGLAEIRSYVVGQAKHY